MVKFCLRMSTEILKTPLSHDDIIWARNTRDNATFSNTKTHCLIKYFNIWWTKHLLKTAPLTLLKMSSTSLRNISSTLKLSLALASQKRIPDIREANCQKRRHFFQCYSASGRGKYSNNSISGRFLMQSADLGSLLSLMVLHDVCTSFMILRSSN